MPTPNAINPHDLFLLFLTETNLVPPNVAILQTNEDLLGTLNRAGAIEITFHAGLATGMAESVRIHKEILEGEEA